MILKQLLSFLYFKFVSLFDKNKFLYHSVHVNVLAVGLVYIV